MSFSRALIFGTALSIAALGGCSIYKSSDRESFDSNALAGAPTPKSLVEAVNCRKLLPDELDPSQIGGLDLSSRDEDSRVTRPASSTGAKAEVELARRFADRDSVMASYCRVRFTLAGDETDETLIDRTRALVETL